MHNFWYRTWEVSWLKLDISVNLDWENCILLRFYFFFKVLQKHFLGKNLKRFRLLILLALELMMISFSQNTFYLKQNYPLQILALACMLHRKVTLNSKKIFHIYFVFDAEMHSLKLPIKHLKCSINKSNKQNLLFLDSITVFLVALKVEGT